MTEEQIRFALKHLPIANHLLNKIVEAILELIEKENKNVDDIHRD